MQNLPGSVRYTLRQFRQSPVFTSAAILTLALGIGGTTAIFTLIHAVMLRSLPVSNPALLYRIGDGDNCCVMSAPQDLWGMYSYPLFERLRAAAPEFDEMAAFQASHGGASVRRQGDAAAARPLRSEYVSGNYFSTLGVRAYGGRLFTPQDDRASAPPAAVLSYQSWQADFGADPSVVGATFVIEGHPFTLVGITPPGFFGETLRADPPDIWIPVQQEPLIAASSTLLHQSTAAWLRAIGRVHPGASTAGVGPRLTAILRQWMQHDAGYPANWMPDVMRGLPAQVINVVPGGSGVAEMKDDYGRSLQILLAVCGLVWLIACANVANLLLARAAARRTQTAVRMAVGASRREIVVQALIESITLAIAGGVAGLFVAIGAARLLLVLAFRSARLLPISVWPSPLVLAFAFAVALLTGILFGAAPAWFATRTDPVDALRGSGRSTSDHAGFARKALLIVQAALSVVLVAGATMLARSLDKLEHQNMGYRTDGRIVVFLERPLSTYPFPKLQTLYRQMEDTVNQLPGVRGSGLATYNPLYDNWSELVLVAGHPIPTMNENATASWDRVSADYLQNLGLTAIRGRNFTHEDNENSAPVAVVNEAFARQFFKKGEDPIGQHFGMDLPENANTFRIVGIVPDSKFRTYWLRRPVTAMFYVPLGQFVNYKNPLMQRVELGSHFISGLMLVTSMPPGALEPALKRALAAVDPNLTIISVMTLRQRVALMFGQDRAVASLAGLFGAVALLLAAVGLYGVTAYTVAQRTNEIGVRMALGADRASVVRHVLRGAFVRVAVGLVLGLPLAIAAGRLISSQLYDVAFWDPLALALAASALAVCSFVAALIPASVAASISPMTALRSE
jgi:predicted permease